ncbi:MAG: hypothetical protein RLZZ524_1858 [Pseudomonadota bacterium]
MATLRFLPAVMPMRGAMAVPLTVPLATPLSAASTAPAAFAIPALDGLRALAVLLVFLAHSGLEGQVPGGLGVTVFFVLSGYLITTLLRREQARTGRIDLRAFWARRLLRLMPPLLLVLLATLALSQAGWIAGRYSPGGFLAALFYAGNLHAIAQDFHGLPAGIGVVWSLAIEEHFYLLYPLLAAWLLRRASPAASVRLLLALCGAVLAWRIVLVLQGASAERIGMGTDTRIDAILAGCALALWRPPQGVAERAVGRAAGPSRDAAAALACLAVLLASVAWREPVFRETLRYTLQAGAVAGLMHLAVRHARQAPARWLDHPVLVWLGAVSYTVYLAHHVILLGVARRWPLLDWPARTGLALLLTLALAWAMQQAVERPCARLRQRFRPGAGRAS